MAAAGVRPRALCTRDLSAITCVRGRTRKTRRANDIFMSRTTGHQHRVVVQHVAWRHQYNALSISSVTPALQPPHRLTLRLVRQRLANAHQRANSKYKQHQISASIAGSYHQHQRHQHHRQTTYQHACAARAAPRRASLRAPSRTPSRHCYFALSRLGAPRSAGADIENSGENSDSVAAASGIAAWLWRQTSVAGIGGWRLFTCQLPRATILYAAFLIS